MSFEHHRIKVKNHLDRRWSAHFDGLTVTSDGDETTIAGLGTAQAALQRMTLTKL